METHSHVLLGFRRALMRPSQSLCRSVREGSLNFKRPRPIEQTRQLYL